MAKTERMGLTNLTNAAHFQHMEYTISLAEEYSVFSTNEIAKQRLEALKKAFKEEDRCLMLSKGSTLTEKISKADSERDKHYSTYKQMVKAMRKMPSPVIEESAKELWQHISDYKISTANHMDKQTALLTNFIDDLQNQHLHHLKNLNLEILVEEMRKANEEVKLLVKQRALNTAGEAPGSLRSARVATDKAYLNFLEVVDSMYVLLADDDVKKFIHELNTIVARTKAGTTKQKKKED